MLRMEGIGCVATMCCWLMVAGCWLLDIALGLAISDGFGHNIHRLSNPLPLAEATGMKPQGKSNHAL
ncbi:MAG: hypothetical protein IKO72_01145 [Kiritimatiellae bacterium]|nr:hypothetical protein [Kiritimatiellia bacterium]